MPIFFQQTINEDTKLGVWKIEEAEEFFLQAVMPQRNVSHPHKKLQHLAGRYLLSYLFPDFPVQLIQIADTRKPFLEDEAYHFSISHCGNFAAAIVSKTKRVGVDIELVTPKVERIKHKFLTGQEQEHILIPGLTTCEGTTTEQTQLTLLWSSKEAVFKWYGKGEVDFKEHIVVKEIKQTNASACQLFVCFKKGNQQDVLLHSHLFQAEKNNSTPGVVLSFLVT